MSAGTGTKLLSWLWTIVRVVVWAFVIANIFTAAMVWLFPRFSYGLVERWVCPAGSSIEVQGTGLWFIEVLADDAALEFPKVTCVSSQGTVVLRGDSGENLHAYWRVFGVFLLVFVAMAILALLSLRWFSTRQVGSLEAAVPRPEDPLVERLRTEIAELQAQRAAILQGRPQIGIGGCLLFVPGAFLTVYFGLLLLNALALEAPMEPANLVGCMITIGVLASLVILDRRIRSKMKRWKEEHEQELGAIDARISARKAELAGRRRK